MNINISEFIWGNIKSLFLGSIFFLIVIYFLPSSWKIWGLRKLDKKLVDELFSDNRKFFNEFITLVLNKVKSESFSDNLNVKNKIDKLHSNIKDLENIESNLFTIELLDDLIKVIYFNSSQSGDEFEYNLEYTIQYFEYYSKRLVSTSYRRNFSCDIIRKFNESIKTLQDIKDITIEVNTDAKNGVLKSCRRQKISEFLDFLKNEKEDLINRQEEKIAVIKQSSLELYSLTKG